MGILIRLDSDAPDVRLAGGYLEIEFPELTIQFPMNTAVDIGNSISTLLVGSNRKIKFPANQAVVDFVEFATVKDISFTMDRPTPRTVVYKAFCKWCKMNQIEPLTNRTLYQEIVNLGYSKCKTRAGRFWGMSRNSVHDAFRGFKLKGQLQRESTEPYWQPPVHKS